MAPTLACLVQNVLEEELLQQPLNDLLYSAADVTLDTWPPVASAEAAAAAAAGQQHTAAVLHGTSSSKQLTSDSSSSSSSTALSIFGSNSLMTYDQSTGVWDLAATPARFRHNSSGHWLSRGSCTGSSLHHVMSCGSRRSATGSRGEAAGLGALTLRANSITGRGANSLASSGVAGAGAAADEVLDQPQQASQGQQQVLLFAGLFLARRQQFPLLVQVSCLLHQHTFARMIPAYPPALSIVLMS